MDYFRWQMDESSKFPAELLMNNTKGQEIPVLIISRNSDCYSSLPVEELDFIIPMDISFEEADKHIKEKLDDFLSEISESQRLNYACEIFKSNFIDQLNAAMNFLGGM